MAKPPHLEIAEEKMLQEGVKRVTIATLTGVPKYYTFRVRRHFAGSESYNTD
jgi:hypothetical protein